MGKKSYKVNKLKEKISKTEWKMSDKNRQARNKWALNERIKYD